MTREEAIENLKELLECSYVDSFEDVENEALRIAIKALEQTRWILVSERLPEANGRYLVTRGLNACGALWNRVYIVNYSDLMGLKSERIWWDGNVGKSDFKRIDDVIAWMPLPEPYKPEIKTEQALAYADQDTLMPAT